MQPIPKDRDEIENYIAKQKSAIASFKRKAAESKKDKYAAKFRHTVELKTKHLNAAEARLAAMPTKRSRNQES